jgi:hypothetical protein
MFANISEEHSASIFREEETYGYEYREQDNRARQFVFFE